MKTVRVVFDGRVFVPQEVVDLPVGTELEIQIPDSVSGKPLRPLQRLIEIAEKLPVNPDTPVDLAEQHDHYLYGTPKRP